MDRTAHDAVVFVHGGGMYGGPSGVEVLRETSSQKRRVEITALGFVFRSTGSSNPAAISSAPFPVQLHPFGRHKLKAN